MKNKAFTSLLLTLTLATSAVPAIAAEEEITDLPVSVQSEDTPEPLVAVSVQTETAPGEELSMAPAAESAETSGSQGEGEIAQGTDSLSGSGEEDLSAGSESVSGSEAEESETDSSGSTSGSSSESSSSSVDGTSESSSSSSSLSEELTGENQDPDQEAIIVSFEEVAPVEVKKGASVGAVLTELPGSVVASLSNGERFHIPVDWSPILFNSSVPGDGYSFTSTIRIMEDGTPYVIGYSLAEGLLFPTARVIVKDDGKIGSAQENEGQLVMDDVTGANISAIEGETRILNYLMSELGLNQAAACGVLANIYYESNFNPHAIGDNGTSYGICQWHLERYTALVAFCNNAGLSYGSVEGQLRFLEYELRTSYPGVLNHLLSVPNTPEGAFDAGYFWCYHFERPATIQASSVRRGNAAKNSYFARYQGFAPTDYTGGTIYQGIDYAPVFNFEYFLKVNPDLKEQFEGAPESALEYFVTKGMDEGLIASSEFDLASYKARYADVRETCTTNKACYEHYMKTGKEEGRNATDCVYDGVSYASFFDYNYYVEQYPLISVAFKNDSQGALEHFLFLGRSEGKRGLAEDPLTICLTDMA